MDTGDDKKRSDKDEFDEFLNRLAQQEDKPVDPKANQQAAEEQALEDLRSIFTAEQPETGKLDPAIADQADANHAAPVTEEDAQDSLEARLNGLREELSQPDAIEEHPTPPPAQPLSTQELAEEPISIPEAPKSTPPVPTPVPSADDDHWQSLENRLADLQQNFNVDISDKDKKRQQPSLMEIINGDDPTSHATGKLVYGFLILIILILLGVIGYAFFRPGPQADPNATAGNASLINTYPVVLSIANRELKLQPYEIPQDGALPAGQTLWLRDTFVHRLFVLPSDALDVKTFETLIGQTVQVRMNNSETVDFTVSDLVQMDAPSFLALATDTANAFSAAIITADENGKPDPQFIVIHAQAIEPVN